MSVDWDDLVHHIAHDARALVRRGLTNAQLLERLLGPAADPEAAGYLRSVIDSQMGLNRLFVRLVALADAERLQRSSTPILERIDLETAVLGAKLECGEAIRRAEAELVIGELPAKTVAPKVQMVLRELLDNSLRYFDSSRRPRVDVAAEADEKKLRVRVSDNGVGVAPAYVEKLFQPLERLDPVRSGFGLGLAISRAIVEASGGTIYFEPSDPGAHFVFELPNRD
jgi:signal transduction histidine kinase